MNETYESKKFGADKIVFLGMFIISLLIAQLIVSANSVLVFSDPIELAHSGLSLSIPTGKGWKSTEKWLYADNAFVLSSSYKVEGQFIAAAVSCWYLPVSLDQFEKIISDPNIEIVEKGLIHKGNLEIDWVHIKNPSPVYLGNIKLPDNRTVNIKVIQTTFEIEVAEKVFKKIIESMIFEKDNPVKTGAEIVTEIKSKGIDTFINNLNKQACFFIRDSGNHNLGFTVDLIGNSSADEQFHISAASQLFYAGREPQEQITLFDGNKYLNMYAWQSQTLTRTGRLTTKTALDESGSIKVTNMVNDRTREEHYHDGSMIVPTIFLELLVGRVVENNIKEAVVDMIDSSGNITPALLTFKPVNENTGEDTKVVTLEFLNGKGFSDLLYLNDDNQISKEIIQHESTYKLERTDIESIEAEFPDQAGDIINQNQLLDSNSL
jgi:hypothetical protein